MTKVLIAGLPGNMATTFAKHALKENKISVLNWSITGVEVDDKKVDVNGHMFDLVRIDERSRINQLFEDTRPDIIVDYTEPDAVEENVGLYCRKKTSFIMGTTGVVRNKISRQVKDSDINAVVAPNMGKQIVAMQAMFEYAAQNFPDCFEGYKLTIKESHQQGKQDTSGTAKAMAGYFNQLGIGFDIEEIKQYRMPEDQLSLGVPEDHLGGHAWHTYAFTSADKSVHFEIVHNVNGREIYAKGTIDSIFFLDRKNKSDERGKVFSMIDVLKNV